MISLCYSPDSAWSQTDFWTIIPHNSENQKQMHTCTQYCGIVVLMSKATFVSIVSCHRKSLLTIKQNLQSLTHGETSHNLHGMDIFMLRSNYTFI